MSAGGAEAKEAPKYTKKDFESDQDVRWCPGCGDYAILSAVQKTMPDLGIPKEDIVFISGIGCSSRFPYHMNTYWFHAIHGRAPAVATGLRLARPDLKVFIVTGDGDGLSIGGNHMLHVLRRNVNVTILLFNNRIYGLTKGQYSPTSELGKVTKSTPLRSADRPVSPPPVALGCVAPPGRRSRPAPPAARARWTATARTWRRWGGAPPTTRASGGAERRGFRDLAELARGRVLTLREAVDPVVEQQDRHVHVPAEHVEHVVAADRQPVAVPRHDEHLEIRACQPEPGGDGRGAAVDGVEPVGVHVVRKPARAADPRDEDDVLLRDAEVRHRLLHRGEDRVVPAARAPPDVLVGLEVLLRVLGCFLRLGAARAHIGLSTSWLMASRISSLASGAEAKEAPKYTKKD